eukprot:11496802-Alexandrium_andersonii.AAC.1
MSTVVRREAAPQVPLRERSRPQHSACWKATVRLRGGRKEKPRCSAVTLALWASQSNWRGR